MSVSNHFTVVYVTTADEDRSYEVRQNIRDCLSAGLDVLVVCAVGVRRRMARMAVALSKHDREFPGCRVAVVAPSVQEFLESLPSAVVRELSLFESKSQAIDWLGIGETFDSDHSTVVWPVAC